MINNIRIILNILEYYETYTEKQTEVVMEEPLLPPSLILFFLIALKFKYILSRSIFKYILPRKADRH